VLTAVATNQAGQYSVVVTNLYGSVTSAVAVLDIALTPVDLSFNPVADSTVYSLALQGNGKILVAGDFTNLAGQARSGIGRLEADGTLDSSFNPGVVANSFVYPNLYCLAVQPDEKILLGGAFSTVAGQARAGLARLNPDGTLDPGFNPGTDGRVYCLALQKDGKILVAGFFNSLGGQPRIGLGRLNSDGTLDSSFNPIPDKNFIYALALQPDGRILVGGDFITLNGQGRANIARLNPDGTLDSIFNPGAGLYVYSLAVQADGKILVGGPFNQLGGQSRNCIGRLNSDGTVDLSFNPGASAYIKTLVVQANGKILLGGAFSTLAGQARLYLGRLNADGTLDSSFTTDVSNPPYGLAIQADGNILVGGSFTSLGTQNRRNLGRLNNTDRSTQSLALAGSALTWTRGGGSPEVWRTTFESSLPGTDWSLLGEGTRIAGGWQLTGLSLPRNANLRARGYATGGEENGSAWFVESVLNPLAFASHTLGFTNGHFWFDISGSPGQAVTIESSPNLQSWTPMQTNTLGTASLRFIDPQSSAVSNRFYRILSPPN
jgi:uncharacterized delta-60 repeat protein